MRRRPGGSPEKRLKSRLNPAQGAMLPRSRTGGGSGAMGKPEARPSQPEPAVAYRFGGYTLDPARGVLQDPRDAEAGLFTAAVIETLRHAVEELAESEASKA